MLRLGVFTALLCWLVTHGPGFMSLGVDAQETGRVAVWRARIGVDPNPKAGADYMRDSKAEAIRLMRSTTRVNHYHYAAAWEDIERVQGVYTTDDLAFEMRESAPLPVAFVLRIVTAGSRNMPGAYAGLPWDSPQMIERISGLIEAIAPVVGQRPWSYAVGNEIDTYFSSRPAEIAAYARMLQQIKPRIRALHPRALFTSSFQAEVASQLRTQYAPIVATLDSVSFMYYPLSADYVVRSPSVVPGELQALADAAAPRPVYFQEIGYPTSPLLGSSLEAQAQFVRLVYETVRSLGPARALGATYLFQADFPDWVVERIAGAYNAGNHQRFREYIRTLGLRDDRDRPKPGWREFVKQTEAMAPAR